MFNRLQVQDGLHTSKKRKVSKTALLKQAEAQVATGDGEAPSEKVRTGATHMRRCRKCNCLRRVVLQVSEQSWKKVMHLAKGEKILDDPNRLRRSIKKEAKDKQKKAKEWQERNDAVQKKKVQRQEKYAPTLRFAFQTSGGLFVRSCSLEVTMPVCHNASLSRCQSVCRRTANLQQRVDKKQAKKKAKREARFLGAGFEGRTPALRGAGAA